MAVDHTATLFAAQLILLLLFGRLLGEGMTRVGQPAIFGQLLAGVLLGPSVFGAVMPGLRQQIFPDLPALKHMIDAISQIGILLLLLLTGMETNLALVNRKFRTVVSTSAFGIAVPFAGGVMLAYAMPASLLAAPDARLVAALFIGTALSISSVKIVAMVLMEVGAIRRDLGQLILATAILDDTIAWIMIALIAGIAAHGSVNLASIGGSLAGTALFLTLSLTLGRRVVARIIRWSNDSFVSDVPVITAILLIMLSMALITDLLGVHTALGAFIAGTLIGQSPILTEHIEGELRGFIIAFFSPVFFAVAGLGMDLRTLLDPTLLFFTFAVILIASLGKFLGALAGGRIGGLTTRESLALATALNARGSTEVIIASIGLSMGALSNQLYTMIVAMALVTTLAMPPSLRWFMARVPLRDDEEKRLEREDAESRNSVPKMERALVYVDGSGNGTLAASLAGLFAAPRQVLVTVLGPAAAKHDNPDSEAGGDTLAQAATLVRDAPQGPANAEAGSAALSIDDRIQTKSDAKEDAAEREVVKGYGIVFVGVERPISRNAQRFDDHLQRLIEAFDGPVGIVFGGANGPIQAGAPLNILVPTGGTPETRLATEIALELAKATKGTVTALHVFDPREDTDLLRGRARRQGMSILVDARQLGRRSNVTVKGLTATNSKPEIVIEREARSGRYGLVLLGASLRQGDSKFLGPGSAALLRSLDMPTLLIAR